ncbi:hypothetical protein BKA81DRAFT_7376 [Phyllosticta paracitricarpa]
MNIITNSTSRAINPFVVVFSQDAVFSTSAVLIDNLWPRCDVWLRTGLFLCQNHGGNNVTATSCYRRHYPRLRFRPPKYIKSKSNNIFPSLSQPALRAHVLSRRAPYPPGSANEFPVTIYQGIFAEKCLRRSSRKPRGLSPHRYWTAWGRGPARVGSGCSGGRR